MKKLSKLIQHRLAAHHLDQSALSSEVIYVANQWIRQNFNSFSLDDKNYPKVTVFKEGSLIVCTSHSVMSHQLFLKSNALKRFLNNKFSGKVNKILIKNLT